MHLASLRSRKRTRSLPRSCCPAHQRPADRSPSRVWLVLACLGSAPPGLGGFACRTVWLLAPGGQGAGRGGVWGGGGGGGGGRGGGGGGFRRRRGPLSAPRTPAGGPPRPPPPPLASTETHRHSPVPLSFP